MIHERDVVDILAQAKVSEPHAGFEAVGTVPAARTFPAPHEGSSRR